MTTSRIQGTGRARRRRRRASPDCYVVDTAPLAVMLQSFITSWSSTRPATRGQFNPGGERSGDVAPIGPIEYLAAETGLRQTRVKNIVYASSRYPRTPLSVADTIVTALGHPEVFHDGTLEPRPNPNAPRRCCGGSGG